MKNLKHLADRWPSSIVARRKVGDFSGGVLTEKYMANLESLGQGPMRLHIGRQVVYPVDSLIDWMEKRAL
jgi:hypothetical protein